jgi:endonuclease/exonuclease/phosphatase (EEP) superfamily protein YafD
VVQGAGIDREHLIERRMMHPSKFLACTYNLWASSPLLGASQSSGERTIVVATAHFSWTGEREHLPEQGDVRIRQAEAAVDALNGLADEEEPVLFMGDFNDCIHPIRVLKDAGFVDSFSASRPHSANLDECC